MKQIEVELKAKLNNPDEIEDKLTELGKFMAIEVLNMDYQKAVAKISEFYKKLGVQDQEIMSCEQNYFNMMIAKKS